MLHYANFKLFFCFYLKIKLSLDTCMGNKLRADFWLLFSSVSCTEQYVAHISGHMLFDNKGKRRLNFPSAWLLELTHWFFSAPHVSDLFFFQPPKSCEPSHSVHMEIDIVAADTNIDRDSYDINRDYIDANIDRYETFSFGES